MLLETKKKFAVFHIYFVETLGVKSFSFQGSFV